MAATACPVCELHAESTFKIEGMDCHEEVAILERRLKRLTGLESLDAIAAGGGPQDHTMVWWDARPQPRLGTVELREVDVQTDLESAAAITALAEDLGKVPAQANDFPGFVSNRILMPFINEAVWALHDGVAEAERIELRGVALLRRGVRLVADQNDPRVEPPDHLGHRGLGVAELGNRVGHRHQHPLALRGRHLLAGQPMAASGQLLDLHGGQSTPL